jgi:glycosyltransferase involved in cell wall biosynthesis
MSRRSLDIGFVTIANLPQGTGRTGRLRTLAAALSALGHRIMIWNQHGIERTGSQEVFGCLGNAKFEYVLGVTERRWGFHSIRLKIRAVANIRRRIIAANRDGHLDVLLFNHLSFYDTYPLTRLAQRLRIPTIQCYEDERRELVGSASFSQRVFGLNSWLADQWCSPMADQIWVISSYLQEKYARLSAHTDRVHVVPTIINCEDWSLPSEPTQTPPVILYSGSFTEQDDIEKLALVFGCLKRKKVDFRARFLGADPNNPRVQHLRGLLLAQDVNDCVELLGFQPAEVVKREVARANVLLNLRTSSLWSRSGLSTKLSEYMASGRTVLTTNVGDNALYVQDGESAIVVHPEDPPAHVANRLGQVLQNPELRRKLGKGARQAALRHFDVPVISTRLQQSLETLPMARMHAQKSRP